MLSLFRVDMSRGELPTLTLEDKVIERCTKDEYSLFGSRLRTHLVTHVR